MCPREGGFEVRGTSCSKIERVTWVWTAVVAAVSSASTGSDVTGGLACARVSWRTAAAATGARPLPVKPGKVNTESTHAPTAPSDKAAPRLRLRRGGVLSQRAVRIGRSTATNVIVATTKLKVATPRFSTSESGWPSAAGTRMSIGQCHRYHE